MENGISKREVTDWFTDEFHLRRNKRGVWEFQFEWIYPGYGGIPGNEYVYRFYYPASSHERQTDLNRITRDINRIYHDGTNEYDFDFVKIREEKPRSQF
jgi:hypothetical protein